MNRQNDNKQSTQEVGVCSAILEMELEMEKAHNNALLNQIEKDRIAEQRLRARRRRAKLKKRMAKTVTKQPIS